MTLGMYSLVVFTITFLAVMSTIFGGQIDTATAQEAGGYNMLVTASDANPPSPQGLAAVRGVTLVAPLVHSNALYRPPGFAKPAPWPTTGIGKVFVEGGPPSLKERLKTLSSDKAVWERLVTNPHTAVVDPFFLQTGGGPSAPAVKVGDAMRVIDPVTGAFVTRRVIGVTNSDESFSGVFMSKASVEQAVSGRAAQNRFYLATSGSGPQLGGLADRLQGRFVKNGVAAQSFRSIVEENQRFSVQFLRLMQGYLALGLIVGIAGLGVVMVRAVRERRREIGVLRSLGFVSRQVRRAFLLEAGFQSLEGILVGSILALITAAQLVSNGDFGEGIKFIIPWANVTLLCVTAWVASLVATAWPAQQASRIAPAIALRLAD
jgi:putative ABC transport system permease protein